MKLDETPIYYVYAHYKTGEENIPFYIGKGKDKRAFVTHDRSIWWKRVANKYGVVIRLLCENISESEAFSLEKQLIGMFGRADLGNGPLVNMTDGGEGASGNVSSETTKFQISESNKRTKNHPDYVYNITDKFRKTSSNTHKGIAKTNIQKKRMSYSFHTPYTWEFTDASGKITTYFRLKDAVDDVGVNYHKMYNGWRRGLVTSGYTIKRIG